MLNIFSCVYWPLDFFQRDFLCSYRFSVFMGGDEFRGLLCHYFDLEIIESVVL